MISFTVPGQPIGKQRPIAGRSFAGHTTLRTPSKTLYYESLVAHCGHAAMGGCAVLEGAVFVTLDIRVQIPASWSKKKQELARFGGYWPASKPDIDNIEKAIFDGMNGVVWKDDVQVVKVTKQKRYSDQPGVEVHVWLAQEQMETA